MVFISLIYNESCHVEAQYILSDLSNMAAFLTLKD